MNVVICDDHRVFGESLAVVLAARGHHVVACTTEPSAAVDVAREHAVDACLMDLQFPHGSGLDGIHALRAASPDTHVVVLTGYLDDGIAAEARAAGADWCAVKTSEPNALIDTVESLCNGEEPVASPWAEIEEAEEPWERDELARFLTVREREILLDLALGDTTSDMARAWGVSVATIRTHVQSVLNKLGVHSRLEAVLYAVNHGLLERAALQPSEVPD